MLTAASLRAYTGESGALDLLRDLGYPVAPVEVDAAEWRRGGVTVPWNGEATLWLAARMPHFDLFRLTGNVAQESITTFLLSYKDYNRLIKSVIVTDSKNKLSFFDLSEDRQLRRLDVDLCRPTAHSVDRLNLLACGPDESLPRIYDRALDREAVTRQFFVRFRNAVRQTAQAIAAACPGEGRETVDAQALLILSRLLFLSFIQEKGWLNGERRFLIDRLDREEVSGRPFYRNVLLPLFFGCLNTPRQERSAAARKLGRIPYLNGGLFEESSFERRQAALDLPNPLMRRILEEVFERFDFSAAEGDMAGTHVDPEMLGKVFESLMAADERAASGSFYTPKEVVDILTGRAVSEWVGSLGDPRAALERLARITVADPACGSGAFLLSALGVIERLWRELSEAAGIEVPSDLRKRIVANNLYGVDLKPEAVRLCELRLWLAIVSATDGAIESIEPLPNLDRNILQGNSLLSPTDFLGDARLDIYREWLSAVRAQGDLIERYRTAPRDDRSAICRLIRGNDQRLALELLTRAVEADERELQHAIAPRRDLFGRAVPLDPVLCGGLRQRVDEGRALLQRLEEGELDFFSFDVHFAHVMAAGGFDLVIGNPPWVRNSRIDQRARRMLADRYELFRPHRRGTAFHQPDLAVVFFERALSITSSGGIVALLMPAKIANAAYAAPLRTAAASRARLLSIDDWSDDPRARKWFAADTFPLGIVLQKQEAAGRPAADIRVTTCNETFVLTSDALTAGGASSEWALVPPEVSAIAQRLRREFGTLEQVLGRQPIMGVKTGANSIFFLDVEAVEGDAVVTTDGHYVPLDCICRCVRGRDVGRWRHTARQWMLWPPAGGWRETPGWLATLAAARGVRPEEIRLSFVRPEHIGVKVAWKDLSRGIAATVLPADVSLGSVRIPLVPNQTLYSIDCSSADEAHLVAAMLNSTVTTALLLAVAERAKDSHQRYFGRTVAALPWPGGGCDRERLVRLSRRAHRGEEVADDLDRIAAGLYRIAPSELAALRSFVRRRLGGGSR